MPVSINEMPTASRGTSIARSLNQMRGTKWGFLDSSAKRLFGVGGGYPISDSERKDLLETRRVHRSGKGSRGGPDERRGRARYPGDLRNSERTSCGQRA